MIVEEIKEERSSASSSTAAKEEFHKSFIVPGNANPQIAFRITIKDSEVNDEYIINLMKFITQFQEVAPFYSDHEGIKTKLLCETIIRTDMDKEKAILLCSGYGVQNCSIFYYLNAPLNTRSLMNIDTVVPSIPSPPLTTTPRELSQAVADCFTGSLDKGMNEFYVSINHDYVPYQKSLASLLPNQSNS